MGRFINKVVRFFKSAFSSNGLEQELNSSGAGALAVPEIIPEARRVAAESAVLLVNDGTLPIRVGDRVALFGRASFDYFTVGYGSGGDIVAPYKVNLTKGLENAGVKLNEKLLGRYRAWLEKPKNRADEGFWGHWPMSFPEMPLKREWIAEAAAESDIAVVTIGRAAGEDRENVLKEGSYYLTRAELNMLKAVAAEFKRVAVVMNCGNLIDMSWVREIKPGAVLYAWQGGMEAGNAVADVLTGHTDPSGRLPATIAESYSDYPSSGNFGGAKFNNYAEDIYVGYRYFSTFAPEKALFPFGYGLSYTKFGYAASGVRDGTKAKISATVKNIGGRPGKTVVQVYMEKPSGKLSSPARELVAFRKVALEPGAADNIDFDIDIGEFASFDDSGATGEAGTFVLEEGTYSFYVGANSAEAEKVFITRIESAVVVKKVTEALCPDPGSAFDRLVNKNGSPAYERVPAKKIDMRKRMLENMPPVFTSDKTGVTFEDVAAGRAVMEEFVAGLDVSELIALAHGEGKMNSSLGVPGNAGAFGGVSESLREKGVPPMITTDGPSGVRLRRVTALLPCGTALAATFDPLSVSRLYTFIGKEMKATDSDLLLAPGMNIQRDPLCGRNFEYFSEDPFLAGAIAAAVVNGVQSEGVGACPKHFAANNQEYKRKTNDSRVSQRALREIYLKAFETMLKRCQPRAIMTAYNKINGVWCYYNYDLVNVVLRGEWGYDGVVITDWWAEEGRSPDFEELANSAWRVRAGVNVLMPGEISRVKHKKGDDKIELSLASTDGLTLPELRLNALRVLISLPKKDVN